MERFHQVSSLDVYLKLSMSEKKRKRLNGDRFDEDPSKPTPEESSVANYLHKKLPSKEGRLFGMIVRVFVAMEAIELLMESPWARPNNGSKPYLFTSQTEAVNFMATMFQKQMFQRAVRVKKKPSKHREDAKASKTKVKKLVDGKSIPNKWVTESTADESPTVQEFESTSTKSSIFSSISSSINEITKSSSSSRKPMRLEVVDEQTFVLDDPQSFYIWIYEPPPGLFNWLAGAALIICIILCCLFPIWPSELRQSAYYLTIIGSGFLGLLFFIGLVRFCIYLLVWLSTLGQYNFWIFPNYFEDCGFFDSFRPLYSFKHVSDVQIPLNKKGKSKMKSSSNNNNTAVATTATGNHSSIVCSSDPNDIPSLCTETVARSSEEEVKLKKNI
ncbi:unnamed protein product [Heterobilharzia americana]|nr:unnamed protein product [Heterobilharzia americana]